MRHLATAEPKPKKPQMFVRILGAVRRELPVVLATTPFAAAIWFWTWKLCEGIWALR
jgi:hypothetical protein